MGMDEIGELFMPSAALVLPSHSEPWGLVVNESLSYGCPVVVSNVCGCVPDLVIDGVTGYSFPVGNIEALSKAMLLTAEMSADRVAVAQTVPRGHCRVHAATRRLADSRRVHPDDRRRQMTPRVAFVAPLPPPVHGFSNICAAMLDLLRMKSSVSVFDRAPGKSSRFSWLRQLAMPFAYLVWLVRNPDGKLYLALSGGLGQIIDWPYVLISRLFGRRNIRASPQFCVHHRAVAPQ